MSSFKNWVVFIGILIGSVMIRAGGVPGCLAADEGSFRGPSAHIYIGIRDKKAPNLDEYYTFLGGLKLSLVNYWFSDYSYVSFLAAGVGFQRSLRFIVGVSPVIINHASGIGFSFDFFPVSDRVDRMGGPFGMSLNFDLIQLAAYLDN